jgi:ribosomal protein S27AE
VTVVRHLQRVIKAGGIAAIYPEARYSLCGTTAVLPEALGQLCKFLKVPVVTLITKGHHINHPFWNTRHERGVCPTEAEMKLLLTPEDLRTLSTDEINDRIVKEFQYDDFRWQKNNHVRVACPDRAVGLEKVLYQCPECGAEYRMSSDGCRISCGACGKTWEMTEYGELRATEGTTRFSHIPDWYEWERANVKKEVSEGRYSTGELRVSVESLPNAKKFIPLGKGTMVHDMNGFRVKVKGEDGKEYEMIKEVPSMYSCHIEYRYLFKHGDCVDLNTLQDTWYVYPEGEDFAVTKMALATEGLYFAYLRSIGKEKGPGLA